MATLWFALSLLLSIFLLQARPSLTQNLEHAQLVSGDVMLAGMFDVSVVKDMTCGQYQVTSLQILSALTWFLDELNQMDYFGRGIKLGLQVYRSCQREEKAVRNAVDILNHFNVITPQFDNTTVSLLGILGPDSTSEAHAVSLFLSYLPPSQRPLQISSSATGVVLADKTRHSNFFRVIPPDSTQVKVILQLLKALRWNYIAIVYNDDDYGRPAAQELQKQAGDNGICVPYITTLPHDSRSLKFSSDVESISNTARDKQIQGFVFIGKETTAHQFLVLLGNKVTFPRFIFSEAVGLQASAFRDQGKVLLLSKGAFVAAPPTRPLPQLRHAWNNMWNNRTQFLEASARNPWLDDYFNNSVSPTQNCPATDITCWNNALPHRPLLDQQARLMFQFYSVKAVAVFAALLKKMVSIHCRDNQAVGLCPELARILMTERQYVQNRLQTTSFDLEEEFHNVTSAFQNLTSVGFGVNGEVQDGETGGSLYDVYNFRHCQNHEFCFKKVASLLNESNPQLHLDVNTVRSYGEWGQEQLWPNLTIAQCSVRSMCSECVPDLSHEIIMVPGDFYIVAVVPMYDRDQNDAQGCGAIMTSSGADMLESILFSLNEVNSQDGVFNGRKKLGVVILTSCYRELVIKQKLMSLYQGTLRLPDGTNSSTILPHIAGYVGAFYSTISVAMYQVLSKINTRFVMLGPTNTSPTLSDRVQFPFYLRMTTKFDDQARVIMSIVQSLNSSYVQVVYDPDDDYSDSLKIAINELSQLPPFNICVINNVNTSYDNSNLPQVRKRLRDNSWAHVVIVVLQYKHAKNFTDVVTTTLHPGEFVFIGSEASERSQELIDPADGRTKQLDGSFVIYHGLPANLRFYEYLKQLDPMTSSNPWLKYFWEAVGDCYMPGSFEKKDRKPCNLKNLTSHYVQSVWLPFYIEAVKVFAKGLHSAMMTKCNALTLCDELTSYDLVTSLKSVEAYLTDTRQKSRVFDDNGDGTLGYKVFQIQQRPGKLIYKEVGHYINGKGSVAIDSQYIRSATRCPPSNKNCDGCFPSQHIGQGRPLTDEESDDTSFIAFLVVVVVQAIIIIVCVIVIVLLCCRYRRQPPHSPKLEATIGRQMSVDSSIGRRGMTPVPETGAERQRTQSLASSNCLACGAAPNTTEPPYDFIHHHHDNHKPHNDSHHINQLHKDHHLGLVPSPHSFHHLDGHNHPQMSMPQGKMSRSQSVPYPPLPPSKTLDGRRHSDLRDEYVVYEGSEFSSPNDHYTVSTDASGPHAKVDLDDSSVRAIFFANELSAGSSVSGY